jgi:hypothetical protein
MAAVIVGDMAPEIPVKEMRLVTCFDFQGFPSRHLPTLQAPHHNQSKVHYITSMRSDNKHSKASDAHAKSYVLNLVP